MKGQNLKTGNDMTLLKNGKEDFVTEDVRAYLGNNPEIEIINAGIGRNEGLQKSLQNDYIYKK